MSILSQWKQIIINMGLEPTSTYTIKEVKSYYRKHTLSIHPDKCYGCSSERKAELTLKMIHFKNSVDVFEKAYSNPDQQKLVQSTFNDYLHTNTAQYFPNTDISVEGNELLLGKLYYAFGLDGF